MPRDELYDQPWRIHPLRTAAVFDNFMLSRLGGATLLAGLASLSECQIRQFVAAYPEQLAGLFRSPPPAQRVTEWWTALPAESKAAVMGGAPELVGNLDGIPFRIRDSANRDLLARSMRKLRSSPTLMGAAKSSTLSDRRKLESLRKVLEALGGPDAAPYRSLITLDTSKNIRAAIAVGNLDSADFVTFIVPGMFFSVDLRIIDLTDIAVNLHDLQARYLTIFGASSHVRDVKAAATIAWIGYDTPHLLNVGGLELAFQGAANLERSLSGVRAARANNPPFVTIIGHSYGGTAALVALQNGRASVNALALVGSPGSSAQSVSQLAVDNRNVFVGKAAMDPIVNSAFYGSDPGSSEYGAQRMSVSGGVDPVTGQALDGALGHNEYFKTRSESLRNLALIGIDRGEFVTNGSPNDSLKTLDLLRR